MRQLAESCMHVIGVPQRAGWHRFERGWAHNDAKEVGLPLPSELQLHDELRVAVALLREAGVRLREIDGRRDCRVKGAGGRHHAVSDARALPGAI